MNEWVDIICEHLQLVQQGDEATAIQAEPPLSNYSLTMPHTYSSHSPLMNRSLPPPPAPDSVSEFISNI